jgi:hypothetical protein
MTKISQLSDIGGNLAANDEFIIRDVSDASTPNKKVTASGFFLVASALGLTGLDRITAGTVASGTQTRVYESGAAGYAETTVSGVNSARTTISGYFENASGTVGGTFFPVVTQTDIGTDPNQVPVCGMLGDMAFQSSAGVNIDTASVTQFSNVPLLTGGGLKFPPTQVASADPNTLDDYEEGTFTPTITQGVTSPTYGASNIGAYRIVGKQLFFSLRVQLTGGTTDANQLYVGGLPVVALPGSIYLYPQIGKFQGGASNTGVVATAQASVNFLPIYDASDRTAVTGTEATNTLDLQITGSYPIP